MALRGISRVFLPVGPVCERDFEIWKRGMKTRGSMFGSLRKRGMSPKRVYLHSTPASRKWSHTRLRNVGLLSPSSYLPPVQTMNGGSDIEVRVDTTLTDFILDGAKTTTIAHRMWQNVVRAGDTVIDATCGNGHDTLMLAKLVLQEGTGLVIGLDLQQSALDNTASLLDQELNSTQRDKVNLLQLCHSQLDKLVDKSSVRLVAFNLGYQPGGDKSFITQADTTVRAISAAVDVLEEHGIISIMSYIGHPGGREEYEAVREFAASLPPSDWVCSHMEWINKPLCPHLMFLLKQ